jgi:hypothetical protein
MLNEMPHPQIADLVLGVQIFVMIPLLMLALLALMALRMFFPRVALALVYMICALIAMVVAIYHYVEIHPGAPPPEGLVIILSFAIVTILSLMLSTILFPRFKRKITYSAWGVIALAVAFYYYGEPAPSAVSPPVAMAAATVRDSLGKPTIAAKTQAAGSAPVIAPAAKPTEPSPIFVALTSKGFKARNIHAGDFEDDITLELSARNLGKRDIRAFEGTLHFTDLLDNTILRVGLTINDPLHAGTTVTWRRVIEYNHFIDAHQRLRAEPQET